MADLNLRVSAVRAEARDVLRLELVDPTGAELPPFEPGAHLAVELPGVMLRHYSLCGDWRDRSRYVLGVGRAADSRGGSDYVHGQLREGMELRCSRPINNFRLVDAQRYLFIAGGIGITPILAMARWCEAHGKDWRLVYGVRSRQRIAFYEELREWGDRVQFHCDDEMGAPIAVPPLLANLVPGTEVYCCGPGPLMTSVQQHGAHMPSDALHFEWFSAPAAPPLGEAPPQEGFIVELRRSGGRFAVPPNRSILEVLEENGHEVPFSCREGLCGTCETAVCEGEPEHLDYVYPPSQRDSLKTMLVCVSRARSERLVLDL
ncbi:oxidoreductase [Ramlibacter henchirensis]|uniref:Oxidoreductase n=1 Tax=Ramlibacter henchirensis TaxID=204072 RepID=A0A4Z0C753_9BURK|nr:PDR/VanB family oxidoreductase [Ramlibacter henchirensis]TFZ06732.1 oxidoreductase [Ramlibacter henchirensis]